MKLKNRLFFLSLIATLTLMVNLAFPITAFADDETPPPTPTEEPVSPPTAEPTEELVPPEVEPTVAEVLEELPEETEIVIVNEEGQVEPLATEEAAEIILTGDPIWCPADVVTPQDGSSGCSPSYSTLTELLDWLDLNDPNQDGIIWIEGDYDSSDESASGFTLDGFDFANLDNHALTVQGGWDGLGTNTINSFNQSEFNGDSLQIFNWNNDLTLNDLVFNNASVVIEASAGDVTLDNIAVSDSVYDGIDIFTSGDVSMTDVDSSDNDYVGAAVFGETVHIQDSQFNENGEVGLWASDSSPFTITLNNVVANGNGYTGALLFSTGTVEVTNSQFNGNGYEEISDCEGECAIFFGNGLVVLSPLFDESSESVITLNNVTANENANGGAVLFSSGIVEVTNSQFNNNGYVGSDCQEFEDFPDESDIFCLYFSYLSGFGLFAGPFPLPFVFPEDEDAVLSGPSITLNNVTAYQNARGGALLMSTSEIGVFNSQFNNNGYSVESGCEDFDELCFFDILFTGQGLIAMDFFFDGGGEQTGPPITLNNVTANENAFGGAFLMSSNSIEVFNSQFNHNGFSAESDCEDMFCFLPGHGLMAGNVLYLFEEGMGDELSGLPITLNHVTANENYGNGVFLLGDEIIVEYGTFNGNGLGLGEDEEGWGNGLLAGGFDGSSVSILCSQANNNAAFGFEIHTGEATLESVTASGNGWDDFEIDAETVNIFTTDCEEDESPHGPGVPPTIIPITGGEQITCDEFSPSVTLMLPNGDFVTLACPINEFAVVEQAFEESLPGPLGDDNEFISALSAQVIRDGTPVEELEDPMVVSFVIPEGMGGAEFVILFWNGSEWIELEGHVSEDGLHFEVMTTFTGTFVFVNK